MNSVNIFRGGLSRRINNLIVPFLFFGFLNDAVIVQKISSNYGNQILVSNSQGMKNNAYEELGGPDDEKLSSGLTEKQQTVINDVKSDITNYLNSNEYRERLIKEFKLAKIPKAQLQTGTFLKEMEKIVLSEVDYTAIDSLIKERVLRLNSTEIVFVYQFYNPVVEGGKKIYIPEPPGSGHFGMMREANGKTQIEIGFKTSKDGKLQYTQQGKVYILDILAHPGVCGVDDSDRESIMKNTIYHELGGHGLTNGNLGLTAGSKALYEKFKKIYNQGGLEAPDASEQQAMLMSIRYRMKQKGIISSVDESINEEQMGQLKSAIDYDTLKAKIKKLLEQPEEIDFVKLFGLKEMICLDIMFLEDTFKGKMDQYYNLINSLTYHNVIDERLEVLGNEVLV